MGGSHSKSKSSSSSTKTYKDTTTTNPYVMSHTNDKGTTTELQKGTALESLFNFTNKNIDSLLNQYLNPNQTNNAVNQAKMDLFNKQLADNTRMNLENNIIAPLNERNMLRSSQATDLYNQLARQQNEAIGDYSKQLTANAQQDTANTINTLLNAVLQGYNVISGNQAQSLNTSAGNASTHSSSKGTSTGLST